MIRTDSLSKRYGSLVAVDQLSFEVAPGEILGFLGPNGAGKTTTMRMIAGFISPTSGSATVCGHSIEDEPVAAKRCIGYLPEGAPSYGEMTPRSFLGFIADIRGLGGSEKQDRIGEAVDKLNLSRVMDQTIDTLSKGFKRRLGLAQAILHDPKVLILDEPTDGLDPNQKHEVRQLISEMAKDKIVVISTHILEEVDAVCSRAIIISEGRILADDTPQNLAARSRYHNAVTLTLSDNTDFDSAAAQLAALPEVADSERVENRLTLFPRDGSLVLPAVTALADSNHWSFDELHLEVGRLDEVFRVITGGARQ